MLSDTKRIFVAITGIVIIIGNLFFLFVPHGTDLLDVPRSLVTAIVLLAGVFLWCIGLLGFFLPFLSIEWEKATVAEKRACLLKMSIAMNIAGVVSWFSLVPREQSLVQSQAQGGGSIMTLLFFLTWSFAGAIIMVQQMPKLPRIKIALIRA